MIVEQVGRDSNLLEVRCEIPPTVVVLIDFSLWREQAANQRLRLRG